MQSKVLQGHTAKVGDTWYRINNGFVDEYVVVKTTPCGVWIVERWEKDFPTEDQCRRFVNALARKRYACPTREEARESFIARKRRQIKIMKAQIERIMIQVCDVAEGNEFERFVQLVDKPVIGLLEGFSSGSSEA